MFELTVCTKEGRELRRYELTGARPIRIGRGVDCDIQIGVPEVSRRHAQIELVDDDEWVIKDLNSTHGVLVKGERVREVTIRAGMEITIGPAILRFEDAAARIGAEINEMLDGADSADLSGSHAGIEPHADTAEAPEATPVSEAPKGPVKPPKKGLLGLLGRKKKG